MRSFAISVGVILGLELLIMALVGIVPPTMRVHWIILGIGVGFPLGLVILGVLIGLLLTKLGFKAPGQDAVTYIATKDQIHLHSHND